MLQTQWHIARCVASGSRSPNKLCHQLLTLKQLCQHSKTVQLWQDCLQVDYLWAPRHIDLVPTLAEYHAKVAEALPIGLLTYVTFAGFWEDQSEVPGDYLKVLDSIRARAKLLIVVAVPTVRAHLRLV